MTSYAKPSRGHIGQRPAANIAALNVDMRGPSPCRARAYQWAEWGTPSVRLGRPGGSARLRAARSSDEPCTPASTRRCRWAVLQLFGPQLVRWILKTGQRQPMHPTTFPQVRGWLVNNRAPQNSGLGQPGVSTHPHSHRGRAGHDSKVAMGPLCGARTGLPTGAGVHQVAADRPPPRSRRSAVRFSVQEVRR